MLKVSDDLLKQLIEEMKRQVDFKSNKEKFLDQMLNKKVEWNEKTKEYFSFLHKENIIYNEHYEIKYYDKEFIELFKTIPHINSDNYHLSLYKYQKEQVLNLKEASPTFNYLLGKNVGIMQEDLVVPCITYKEKPFCIMPIKEIMHSQKYEKPRGKILIFGVGLGCSAYYFDKNPNIEKIDIFEPNIHMKKIFLSGVHNKLSDKVKVLNEIKNPWIYDKIFIYDDFLEEEIVNHLFSYFHDNKKVKFTNHKTLMNKLKLEIFRQLVIFIGDPSTRSTENDISKNIYDYFQQNDKTLYTFSDFICFIDDNFSELIKKNTN